MIKSIRIEKSTALLIALVAAISAAVACGAETIVETVVVEREVTRVERVVETVVVEKPVTRVEKVVETVVVEREVAGETVKVVETVVVEKPVTRVEKVVETVEVEVEKVVEIEKQVVATVVIERQVIATATPRPAGQEIAPAEGKDLVLGVNLIPPPIFVPSYMNFQVETFQAMGMFEGLLHATHVDPPLVNRDYSLFNEGIAHSWDLAEDLTSLTFHLRDDVYFHKDWGRVTAEDVVWSFESVMSEGTRSTRGPQIREWAAWNSTEDSGWSAVDDETVRLDLKDLLPTWASALSNVGGGTPVIVSKRLYDERGENSALTTSVGTGPLNAVEWVSDDHILAEPFEDHYRIVPKVNSVRWVLMPEPATQIAAFRVGEIHMAPMAPRFRGGGVGCCGQLMGQRGRSREPADGSIRRQLLVDYTP